MELCHLEEHLSCFQYSTHDATMGITELKKNEDLQFQSDANQIIFVMEGLFNLSYKKVHNRIIKTGESILLPLHSPFVITALEDVRILMMKLNFNITFCNRLPLELLLEICGKMPKDCDLVPLKPNKRLTGFANMVKEYIDDGLKCSFFFDLKIHEFLYLIRVYYDKQDLFNFFKPIYSNDFMFSGNVYKNLDKVKTAKELASALNYSLSGFEKKFKRVFNTSPYQWMQEQKAKKIYHEIHCSKKTFTEMAFDYEFSSPAHFNVFCKLFFGQTPGELRKENMQRCSTLFV